MIKSLLCGTSSFVANGVEDVMRNTGIVSDMFSRGNESRYGDRIYGKYIDIASNKFLNDDYDIVINFAVLKDDTVENNIRYIESLLKLCAEKNVKKLIHFSTIMNYNYHLPSINEKTDIETLKNTSKRGYAEIKIAVDNYLLSVKDSLSFELILVRPGYVLADNRPCPFIKPLRCGCAIIKGDKKSRQPIVKREDIHEALIKIINIENNDVVYHFFPNDKMTKYRYAKLLGYKHIIVMPKLIFKYVPLLLRKIEIMPKSLYSRFDGMYIESDFSSERTEDKLSIKFN
jgi:NAD dependent epimerase/dehydratase family.